MDHITPPDTTPPMRRVSRRAKRLAAGLLVAALATVGVSSWAQGRMHGGEHGRGGHAAMFSASPERIARIVDRLLDGVNATDAQRSQVKQIAQAAAVDLKAQHEAGRTLREQGALLFVAPAVDAAQVEALRQQVLAQHDAYSRRITQALLEVSKVLTPEQRAQLAQRMKQRGEHRRWHHKSPATEPKPLG